jgi:hypothetical protein
VTNDCETHAGRFDSSDRQKVIREDVLLRGARFFTACDSKDTLFVSWDHLPRHAQQIAAEAIEGRDLQKMNDRRLAYIAALKAADQGDMAALMTFIDPRGDL